MTSILIPSVWSCVKRSLVDDKKKKQRPNKRGQTVAISITSYSTHCTEVGASGNLNQNHGVAEGKRRRGEASYYRRYTYKFKTPSAPALFSFQNFFESKTWNDRTNSITPVDICCRRHVGAASQHNFWRNIHTIDVSTVEVVTATSKVLLSVECQPII